MCVGLVERMSRMMGRREKCGRKLLVQRGVNTGFNTSTINGSFLSGLTSLLREYAVIGIGPARSGETRV